MGQGQLFLSYRRTQGEAVRRLKVVLEAAGIRCFLDEADIDPLADFPERIREGIAESHAFLAWWSADYGASDHCQAEFMLAWQHARRQGSDVGRRVWVLNPEAHGDHVAAGEINHKNFLIPPAPGQERAWADDLCRRLDALLPEGPLSCEPPTAAAPLLRNVPHPSPQFTGRNAELMRVHSKLHPPQIGGGAVAVAVQTQGLGGVGKTELAARYARDFAHAYPGGVYWLNLAGYTPGNLAQRDAAAAAWLAALQPCFPGETELFQDDAGKPHPPEMVRHVLERRFTDAPASLWVLDDVPVLRPSDARERAFDLWRAPGPNGRTLATTRDSVTAAGFQSEPLHVLGEDDALRLLARYRRPKPDEMERAKKIVAEVGAHTLALGLLGERLREDAGGYTREWSRLQEAGTLERIETIADELREELGEKACGIVATFQVSIGELDDGAQVLLALAGACAPNEPIPLTLLEAAFDNETREGAFNQAIRMLLGSSLLTRRRERDEAGAPVEIHPMIAQVAQRLLGATHADASDRIAAALVPRIESTRDIRTHAGIADDISHARQLAMRLETKGAVALGLSVGRYDATRGFFTSAQIVEQRALDVARRILGEQHSITLIAMNNLATTLSAQGDLVGARALQEMVFVAQRRTLGEDHPDTLASMNNLAETLRAQGDLAGARALHEQGFSISRRTLGAEHSDTLASMNNLAETMRAQGDLAGARGLHKEALAICRRVVGEEHPDTLTSMNNLAATIRAQGDFASARVLQEEVLAVRRRVLGDEHPDTLAAMNNLAGTLGHQGDLAGARALEEQALAVRRRVHGDEHPDTLTAISNLAGTMRAQGELADAHARLQQVLAARRRVQGDEHPDTLTAMNNLAGMLGDLGDLASARALQEQVVVSRRRVLGEEHPDTLASMNNLAEFIRDQGDLAGARSLREHVLAVCRRVLGNEHPDTLIAMNNLAGTLQAQGDLAGARALQEQALAVRRRVLGEEHPHTIASAWNLLGTLRKLGDHAAARSVLTGTSLGRLPDIANEALPAELRRLKPRIRELKEELGLS